MDPLRKYIDSIINHPDFSDRLVMACWLAVAIICFLMII